MNYPVVCVMMSVFNGEKYIADQIDSIIAQEDVSVRLIVRDDGSSDSTLDILKSYSHRIEVLSGANLGVAESFMEVAFAAPLDADYYSFSDADDVWQPTKLSRAISMLSGQKGPALYGSPMLLVSEDLTPIGPSVWLGAKIGFRHALIQGGIGGATSVANREMFSLFRMDRPRQVALHDHWLYLLASGLGEIVFDTETRILYRQHSSNAVSGSPRGVKLWKRRLASLLSADPAKLQAVEFDRLFGKYLDPEKRTVLQIFAYHDRSLPARLSLLFNCPLTFNNARSRVFFLAKVALFRT